MSLAVISLGTRLGSQIRRESGDETVDQVTVPDKS